MSANFVSNTAILCWLGTSFHFCFMLFFFSMVPDHMPLGVSSMKLPPAPMGLGFIIAYCIKTAQSSTNPLLVSKITKQGQTGSFFFILSCGTGTSLKCGAVVL